MLELNAVESERPIVGLLLIIESCLRPPDNKDMHKIWQKCKSDLLTLLTVALCAPRCQEANIFLNYLAKLQTPRGLKIT